MRQCKICGKSSKWGRKYKKTMSVYNPTPQKRKYPNLQWVRLANNKRVKACTKCIKTLVKTK